ncbi:MAG: NAD(P)/FAD-dependent oxidoreductase [Campylobacterales bacterium]|nr:NAD(P)/FAD-dependent oxidoreductase [Campylobacterales bacterium]
MSKAKVYEYTIIGGGASGLMSAILLAQQGKEVLILEKNAQLAKKISISGNGKCNITNTSISSKHFHSQNPSFVEACIESFETIKNLLERIGIYLVEGKGGKVFPMSLNANSVVTILEYECKRLGVEIQTHQEVIKATKEQTFTIQTTTDTFYAQNLIIASGSPAYPQLGSSDIGLHIAQSFNHPIHPILPSLVQLTSPQKDIYFLAGYKQEAVLTLYCNALVTTQAQGDILFTQYGVSGLAILDISRFVSIALANYEYCEIKVDLMPKWSKKALQNLFQNALTVEKEIKIWLEGFIHKKLAAVIVQRSCIPAQTTAELSTKNINALIYHLKNFTIEIDATRGFKGAEVAIGGVDTTQINPQTMQSKRVKNLYFVGEVLDVDGDRGGYNFHFAWSCALKLVQNI